MKQVFWFWSLLNFKSLQVSAPSVEIVKPCYIKWFKRNFSVWDPLGFTKTFPEIQWIWFCALDIQKSINMLDVVNGIVFKVSDKEFEQIKIREQEYDILNAQCFDFENHKNLWNCFFFSANKNNWEYNYWCKAQNKYLEVCLDWAKEYGEEFYNQFLETTFIWDKDLINYA